MKKCKIQWVGDDGRPTPDENPAIGFVQCEAYRYPEPNAVNGFIEYPETEWFPICAEHAKALPGLVHWRFKAMPELTADQIAFFLRELAHELREPSPSRLTYAAHAEQIAASLDDGTLKVRS